MRMTIEAILYSVPRRVKMSSIFKYIIYLSTNRYDPTSKAAVWLESSLQSLLSWWTNVESTLLRTREEVDAIDR